MFGKTALQSGGDEIATIISQRGKGAGVVSSREGWATHPKSARISNVLETCGCKTMQNQGPNCWYLAYNFFVCNVVSLELGNPPKSAGVSICNVFHFVFSTTDIFDVARVQRVFLGNTRETIFRIHFCIRRFLKWPRGRNRQTHDLHTPHASPSPFPFLGGEVRFCCKNCGPNFFPWMLFVAFSF